MARKRAEAEALVARWRQEAALHGPRRVMRRCTVCGTTIGPTAQTIGSWTCSQTCVDARRREQELEQRRKDWETWMVYRHGADSRWPGVVNL